MELHIGENIKRQRKARSMTQEQLAEALGVTVGAVYKWEKGLSMPEIATLVDLADLFEISIDYLLGYCIEKSGTDAAVKRICDLRSERRLEESAREGEKALQKYPNNFEIVFHTAQTYFLTSEQCEKNARRCIELMERACVLFEQNPYDDLLVHDLHQSIAICYIGLKQYDKCIERLKKLNGGGSQNDMIGLVLAKFCEKPEEALPYLTAGFYGHLVSVLRGVVGFAKAYTLMERYDEVFAVLEWMVCAIKKLHDPSINSVMDKFEVFMLTLMADSMMRKGELEYAYSYLREARDQARRFDAAPEYHTGVGWKFFHGDGADVSLDDLGETAMLALEKVVEVDGCRELKELWKEIKDE